MDEKLLSLTPKRFLCPYCGKWHPWRKDYNLEYYDSIRYQANHTCPDAQYGYDGNYKIYFENGYLHYSTQETCSRASFNLDGKVEISSIVESLDSPTVTFKVPFKSDFDIESRICETCRNFHRCNLVKLGDTGDHRNMEIALGFEFEQSDYDKIVKAAILARKEHELQKREEAVAARETAATNYEAELSALADTLAQREAELAAKGKNNKEDNKMKFTGLAAQLYEHSPKENVELVKAWATKYQPVLKWAIPVAAVYAAYRILNSPEFDLSVNNISETCEKKLGFKLELLDNKRALKELMAIGGICAGAYAAVNAISGIFGSQTEAKDITVEEVEAGMNQLESVSKKFAWIQPKTENMLPIACSVILVYVTLHKPKFSAKTTKKFLDLTEDFRIKLDIYIGLAKDFIQNKFQIDLSNEEEQRKFKICAFLVALMGVFAFLYGKKVLGDKTAPEETGDAKERNIRESAEAFIEQAKAIMEKIAPTVYTTLISILVSKKLLMLEEQPEVIPAPAPDEENPPAPAENDTSPVIIDADT